MIPICSSRILPHEASTSEDDAPIPILPTIRVAEIISQEKRGPKRIALFNEIVDQLGGDRLSAEAHLSSFLRRVLEEQTVNPQLADDPIHQLRVAIGRSCVGLRLGHKFRVINEENRVFILKNSEGIPSAVFKQMITYTIAEKAFCNLISSGRMFDNKKSKENEAEVAMYHYSETFNLRVSPPARMGTFLNKKGVYVSYLHGYQLLRDVYKRLEKRVSYSPAENIMWQKVIIAIFATLNYDPNTGNILLRLNASNEIEDIKLIDAGQAIRAKKLPPRFMIIGNRLTPSIFKISKEAFAPEIVEFIRDNMTEENLDRFIEIVKRELPSFWTPKMERVHRSTLQVLRAAVLSGAVTTPRALFKIVTQHDYDNILRTAAGIP